MLQMTAAPDSLLKVIHCNCSSSCTAGHFAFIAEDTDCTVACGPCQHQNWDNPNNRFVQDESEDEDD